MDGVHTEVLVTDYSNRVLLLVTQIGKLGTMYHAAGPGPGGGPGGGLGAGDFGAAPDVRVLAGKHDDELLEVGPDMIVVTLTTLPTARFSTSRCPSLRA